MKKRFLGVPASSASVERMFYISVHIFTNKIRTSVYLYEHLVLLKLNEHYLNNDMKLIDIRKTNLID